MALISQSKGKRRVKMWSIIDIVLLSIAGILALVATTCFGTAIGIYLWEGHTEFSGRLIDVGLVITIVDGVYIVAYGIFRENE